MGWLMNWFRAWRRRRQRHLYEFFDGRRFRRGDPWAIYRALHSDEEFAPQEQLQLAAELHEPEFSRAVRCVHRAFGTKPFDEATGTGLTETEAFATMVEFLEWCDELVKKNGPSPTSSPTSDSESSTSPDLKTNDPTSSPSRSTSSPDESIHAAAS